MALPTLPALAAPPLVLHPNTPLVGTPGLLTTTAIGLNGLQGIATPVHLAKVAGQKQREALIAQALLLYVPKHTPFTPNIIAPYLAPLGAPTNHVLKGKQPAPLFVYYGDRLLNVGNSMLSTLGLPRNGKRVKQPTLPSGLFIAHERAAKDLSKGLRFDTVLGRAYENGIVLFRTNMYAQNDNFWNAHLLNVPLPQPMQRLYLDGTLGPPLMQVQLGGFEGAILLNAK